MASAITNVYADQNRRTYEDYEPFLQKRINTPFGVMTLGEYCSAMEARGYGNKPWNVTGAPTPIAREKAVTPDDILTSSGKSLIIYGFIGRDVYRANVINFLRAMPQPYQEDWTEFIPSNPVVEEERVGAVEPEQDYLATPEQPVVRRAPSIEDERIVAQENTPAISRIDSDGGNVARRLEF